MTIDPSLTTGADPIAAMRDSRTAAAGIIRRVHTAQVNKIHPCFAARAAGA